ncbi:alpha-ribazole phosphatase family protein [Halopseudomonas sp.]|uniref:alpha-ribazole phosphatase family protein n=1 Tax=Halopseudomonas sp. TaxID=2901191 RepID=UPI003002F61B
MSLRLDFLRHGETEQGGGLRGSLDDLLTETGWQQLNTAVAQLAGWQRIVSSPLRRCALFAEQLAVQRNLPLEYSNDLRELHFGAWEGKHPSELMQTQADELGRFWADPYAYTPPGAESLQAFAARIDSALQHLHACYAGQRLLVVCHAGVMRLLLARARGLAPAALLQVTVGYAELVALEFDPRCGLRELTA